MANKDIVHDVTDKLEIYTDFFSLVYSLVFNQGILKEDEVIQVVLPDKYTLYEKENTLYLALRVNMSLGGAWSDSFSMLLPVRNAQDVLVDWKSVRFGNYVLGAILEQGMLPTWEALHAALSYSREAKSEVSITQELTNSIYVDIYLRVPLLYLLVYVKDKYCLEDTGELKVHALTNKGNVLTTVLGVLEGVLVANYIRVQKKFLERMGVTSAEDSKLDLFRIITGEPLYICCNDKWECSHEELVRPLLATNYADAIKQLLDDLVSVGKWRVKNLGKSVKGVRVEFPYWTIGHSVPSFFYYEYLDLYLFKDAKDRDSKWYAGAARPGDKNITSAPNGIAKALSQEYNMHIDHMKMYLRVGTEEYPFLLGAKIKPRAKAIDKREHIILVEHIRELFDRIGLNVGLLSDVIDAFSKLRIEKQCVLKVFMCPYWKEFYQEHKEEFSSNSWATLSDLFGFCSSGVHENIDSCFGASAGDDVAVSGEPEIVLLYDSDYIPLPIIEAYLLAPQNEHILKEVLSSICVIARSEFSFELQLWSIVKKFFNVLGFQRVPSDYLNVLDLLSRLVSKYGGEVEACDDKVMVDHFMEMLTDQVRQLRQKSLTIQRAEQLVEGASTSSKGWTGSTGLGGEARKFIQSRSRSGRSLARLLYG